MAYDSDKRLAKLKKIESEVQNKLFLLNYSLDIDSQDDDKPAQEEDFSLGESTAKLDEPCESCQ